MLLAHHITAPQYKIWSSANRGAIMSHYFYFDILYPLWHYYVLLWHYYITYFFANVQTIIFHYFIISKKTIISLMTLLLFHLFFSSYIIAIIAIMTLLFALFLSQLFVFEPIMSIISIMTLLFELYFCDTIITIMTFPFYYIHYFFPYILCPL